MQCGVEPRHIYKYEVAIAHFRERELDHFDFVRTRIQTMPDACIDTSGSVYELAQYSGFGPG
jgi:hypothetical protein